MAELDDQLRQLAAHRAGSVPAFDPAAARLRAHRSAARAAAVTGIAACVVALLVIGGFAVFAGSDDSPSVHTPAGSNGAPATSAPPTGSSGCPTLDGADESAKDGPSSTKGTDTTRSAVRVGVQASDCVDDVDFSFDLGTPRWSVRQEASTVRGRRQRQQLVRDHLLGPGAERVPRHRWRGAGALASGCDRGEAGAEDRRDDRVGDRDDGGAAVPGRRRREPVRACSSRARHRAR